MISGFMESLICGKENHEVDRIYGKDSRMRKVRRKIKNI